MRYVLRPGPGRLREPVSAGPVRPGGGRGRRLRGGAEHRRRAEGHAHPGRGPRGHRPWWWWTAAPTAPPRWPSTPACCTCVLPVNLGHGAALRLGYELAAAHGARYVVTLDADGQNDPAELAAMLEPAARRRRPTSSSPHGGSGSTRPPTGSGGPACTLYASILNAIVSQQLTDSSNGYRAFRIEVLNDIVPHAGRGPVPDGRGGDHRVQPGLADHRAAHRVAPAGVGHLEEGRQPGLRACSTAG